MNTFEIDISKGQYINEVMINIPTNSIINKTICGCGATSLELNSSRHSIIIEPNLPVILGKKAKHPFIMGVHEGISSKQIEKYLNDNYNDGFYKIMTTPESFGKIRRAIRKVGMNLYTDFFILFDECERATQDIGYRKTIILPMNDFFGADGKAMVSATPIIVEDPRFKEQNFKQIQIKPDYDYRQNLTLVPTNNVYTTVLKYLSELPKSEQVCLFFNSTKGIEALIEYLGIKKHSNIYCGKESKDKLIDKGFENVYDMLNETGEEPKLNKYNFFTSRFYSAVDIELEHKPTVIMVTELFSAPYSMIDPNTEAIQIAGRFRNGISKLIHITNYNRKVKYWTREEKERFLNEQHTIYSIFHKLHRRVQKHGERYITKQALERADYSEFALPNGERNLFMYNNSFREEYIKMVYIRPDRILKEYVDSNAFNVDYRYCFFATTDNDRRIIDPPKFISQIELNKLAFKQIKKLIISKNKYDIEYLKAIVNSYKIISDGISELGFDRIIELGYKSKAIQDAIDSSKLKKVLQSSGVRREVYKSFKQNKRYTRTEINGILMTIYGRFNIPYKRSGCSQRIGLYYNIKEEDTENNRGYILVSKLF